MNTERYDSKATWHRGLFLAAALSGLTAVFAGTFGAHGLKGRIADDLLANYLTGVLYHLVHAVALLSVALIAGRVRSSLAVACGWLMVAGICIFSGSLYVMAMTDQRWLGMITPFGGVSFIVAWLLLAIAAWRVRQANDAPTAD
jgi:uncharacterized membrane protein YgdD (TMEM256/DUF423 family)